MEFTTGATVRVRGADAVVGPCAQALTARGITVGVDSLDGTRHYPHFPAVTRGLLGTVPASTPPLHDHQRVDIEVLVSMASPSPIAASLLPQDQPHLLVLTDEAGVTVGPLVVPGSTACGTCLDLHRTDEDPTWPYVAIQCQGRPAQIDPAIALDVACAVARACEAHLAGQESMVWRIERHQTYATPTPAPHPWCACTDVAHDG